MTLDVQSPAETADDLLCGKCGYNLRGVPSNRCPECGQEFDPRHLISDLIPWEQRRYIGRFRAFRRTAWMASFRPKELAAKLDWPVDRRAARRFLGWVVVIEIVAIYAAGYSAKQLWPFLWETNGRYKADPDSWDWLPNPWSVAVMLAAIVLWLALLTPITAFFFRRQNLPVERQNRVTAISLYTCAPLTWIALALLAGTAFSWVLWGGGGRANIAPQEALAIVSQFICAIAIVVGVMSFFRARNRAAARAGGTPRRSGWYWLAAVLAIGLGGSGLVLSWMKVRTYTREIAPYLATRMGEIGAIVLVAPLAWWWLHSVRLMRLCCGTGTRRNVAAGVMMLLSWALSLVLITATAYALVLVGIMMAAWW